MNAVAAQQTIFYSVGRIILCFLPTMSKYSLRFWSNPLRRKLQNPMLTVVFLVGSIGISIAIARTGMISSAQLITLVINTLRILFAVYILFSILQMFKTSDKGEDRNI
jgi:hypothetical protein